MQLKIGLQVMLYSNLEGRVYATPYDTDAVCTENTRVFSQWTHPYVQNYGRQLCQWQLSTSAAAAARQRAARQSYEAANNRLGLEAAQAFKPIA
jgi:hypothetical protein